jgi:hypothetical protein
MTFGAPGRGQDPKPNTLIDITSLLPTGERGRGESTDIWPKMEK